MIFALVRRASVGNHGQPVCTENLRTCELQSAVVSLSLSLYIYIYIHTHACAYIYIYIYIYMQQSGNYEEPSNNSSSWGELYYIILYYIISYYII